MDGSSDRHAAIALQMDEQGKRQDGSAPDLGNPFQVDQVTAHAMVTDGPAPVTTSPAPVSSTVSAAMVAANPSPSHDSRTSTAAIPPPSHDCIPAAAPAAPAQVNPDPAASDKDYQHHLRLLHLHRSTLSGLDDLIAKLSALLATAQARALGAKEQAQASDLEQKLERLAVKASDVGAHLAPEQVPVMISAAAELVRQLRVARAKH